MSEVTSNLVYTAATNKHTIPTNPNKVSTYGTLLQNFEASNLEELICLNPYNTNLIQNQSKHNGNYIPTSSKENNININLGTEILSVVGNVELNDETLFPLDLISVPVNPALVQPLQNNHQQQGGLSHHEAQRHQEQLLAVQSGRVKNMQFCFCLI